MTFVSEFTERYTSDFITEMGFWLILLTLGTILHTSISGILYPRESESREVVLLDGIWKFRVSPAEDQEKGFTKKWFSTNFEDVSFTNCRNLRRKTFLKIS
jgi:hypothetical protein